eukprot:366442-Chlamydomonas_euryale.AAC.23
MNGDEVARVWVGTHECGPTGGRYGGLYSGGGSCLVLRAIQLLWMHTLAFAQHPASRLPPPPLP